MNTSFDASLESYQRPQDIRDALECRRIAVVGLSSNELRASNFVGFYLKRHGYEVVPVNPREEEIFGLKCYDSLESVPGKIDLVDVFRAPSAVPEIAEQTVAIGAEFIWLQFDVVSPEGIAIAESGGVRCIVDRCIKIEHARFKGRMHWLGFNTNSVDASRRS